MQEHTLTIINIADIEDIPGIPDRPLGTKHVASLVAANDITSWPPIIVTPLNGKRGKYGRIAGKHRIAAAKELGIEQLSGVVRYYADEVAIYIAMWEDNTRHGKPLTIEERKYFARGLHIVNPAISFREIGRRVGLHSTTVKTAIEEGARGKRKKSNEERIVDSVHRITRACNQFRRYTIDSSIEESAELFIDAFSEDDLGELEATLVDMIAVFEDALSLVRQG